MVSRNDYHGDIPAARKKLFAQPVPAFYSFARNNGAVIHIARNDHAVRTAFNGGSAKALPYLLLIWEHILAEQRNADMQVGGVKYLHFDYPFKLWGPLKNGTRADDVSHRKFAVKEVFRGSLMP